MGGYEPRGSPLPCGSLASTIQRELLSKLLAASLMECFESSFQVRDVVAGSSLYQDSCLVAVFGDTIPVSVKSGKFHKRPPILPLHRFPQIANRFSAVAFRRVALKILEACL